MNLPFNMKELVYELSVQPLRLKWSIFVAPELSEVESPCSSPSFGLLHLNFFSAKDFHARPVQL